MKLNKDFTKLGMSFNVMGENREDFISFLKSLGITNSDIYSDKSSIVIVTGRTEDFDVEGKLVAYPYSKGFEKSKIKCRKIMTYAPEENEADVVGKNVRFKSDLTAFELLSGSGIGRIYLKGCEKNNTKFALAFACGLFLSGTDFKTVVGIIGNRQS